VSHILYCTVCRLFSSSRSTSPTQTHIKKSKSKLWNQAGAGLRYKIRTWDLAGVVRLRFLLYDMVCGCLVIAM
jgi:hypothetical protein